MNDRILAAQYVQTGNLMDLCQSEAWLQEIAQVEDEVEGNIEAGLRMRDYAQAVANLTPEQSKLMRQQVKVQSLIFTGLHQWMDSWELGAGFEATYTIARCLIRQRLSELTPEQQGTIDELLAMSNDEQLQEKRIALLSKMFTPEDWQTLARSASQSISTRVLSMGAVDTAV
jgi:hypothetical protein